MKIQIKAVNAENVQDFLHFFDGLAFDDHPDWKICYCYSFHFTGTAEEWHIPGKNRKSAAELIQKGHMRGYLAYHDGVPVGWCNVNDRNNYERLKAYYDFLWNRTKGRICSVVCFVINPSFRGRGIATGLLSGVCEDYKKMGYDYVEAYPSNDDRQPSDHWRGPPSMYEKQGFKAVGEHEEFIMMRKTLKQ